MADYQLFIDGEYVDAQALAPARTWVRYGGPDAAPVTTDDLTAEIVDADATGTWVLNKKATPCIRALKTDYTQPMHETGLLAADAFKGIQQVYFGGDMNAAPALAGQSAGLIHAVKPVQQIIDETVAEFRAALPETAFYIEPDYSNQMCADLLTGILDFAVMFAPKPHPDLHFESVGDVAYHMVSADTDRLAQTLRTHALGES